MSLVGFNIVLVGDNFPVQSMRTSDFMFNHRDLKETLRLPMALTAETKGANLQILPNRLQASTTEVRDPEASAQRLVDMINPFFDYVGRRSLTAVGHNAQFTLGSPGDKDRILEKLINANIAAEIVGNKSSAADLHLYFPSSEGNTSRLAFLCQPDTDSIIMDFNINFDLTSGGNSGEAIALFMNSLRTMQDIATRAEQSLIGQGVV